MVVLEVGDRISQLFYANGPWICCNDSSSRFRRSVLLLSLWLGLQYWTVTLILPHQSTPWPVSHFCPSTKVDFTIWSRDFVFTMFPSHTSLANWVKEVIWCVSRYIIRSAKSIAGQIKSTIWWKPDFWPRTPFHTLKN